jgi:hypothetical protein
LYASLEIEEYVDEAGQWVAGSLESKLRAVPGRRWILPPCAITWTPSNAGPETRA